MSVKFDFKVPIHAKTPNRQENGFARHERRKKERAAVALAFRAAVGNEVMCGQPRPDPEALALLVTMTRIAPNPLDSGDNLNGSLKTVRDALAKELGLQSDRVAGVKWAYAQAKGAVREYAVRVAIEDREDDCSECGAPLNMGMGCTNAGCITVRKSKPRAPRPKAPKASRAIGKARLAPSVERNRKPGGQP